MKIITGVQFKRASRIYIFECADMEGLKGGDHVIVETEFGLGLGKIVSEPREVEDDMAPADLKRVVRIADDSDFERLDKNRDRGNYAFDLCNKLIHQKKLDMKLVQVEYFFDASKAIFYFSAEHRVDFRELVRDLARSLHTRIEMKQIGVRDETKLTGGLGCCGQIVCCSTFLREFHPVSVKMAKEQNLAMNPTKISGLCGRLMCCLAYEHKLYEEIGKTMPKKGKTIETPDGPARVIDVNILRKLVTIGTESGATVTVPMDKLFKPAQVRQPVRQQQKPPAKSSTKSIDMPPLEVTPMQKNDGDDAENRKPRRRSRRRRKKPKSSNEHNTKS